MVDLDGAYDLHVHSAPDLFPRIADDRQMVAHAAARGFAGLVMKNHFEGTASRARLATEVAGGLKVYGGLVLNRYVGGVNPHAVDAALRLGAHNPMPADGYHRFVELLHAEGVAAPHFRVMCRDNGDDLLHG